jgi:hypothetical protein
MLMRAFEVEDFHGTNYRADAEKSAGCGLCR